MSLLKELIASKRRQAEQLEADAAAFAALDPKEQTPALRNKHAAGIDQARQMREWADFAERGEQSK